MKINNYKGTVADRPIDTVVVEPEVMPMPERVPGVQDRQHIPGVQDSLFIDKILSRMNGQNNIVPAGDLPVYNKGFGDTNLRGGLLQPLLNLER